MSDALPDLASFTGSETVFRHVLNPRYRYTEGVQYVAKTAGAYWLLDIVFSHQHTKAVRDEEFQVWKLVKRDDNTATVTMTDGNGRAALVTQEIEYSDFPEPEFVMWLANNTLYLPSEH